MRTAVVRARATSARAWAWRTATVIIATESEVVRQWVRTLALPQVDGVLEDQLHSSCEGMRWRDYAAGRRWPHAAAAQLCAAHGARRLQRLALAHQAALLAASVCGQGGTDVMRYQWVHAGLAFGLRITGFRLGSRYALSAGAWHGTGCSREDFDNHAG